MNSLNFGIFGKKAVLALVLIAVTALFAAAQATPPSQQGRMYGDPGFRGEPVNLNVVNTDIRDILSYFTEQYGVNFVIDKSVGKMPVTVNLSDVPWNVALDSILQSQQLGVLVQGNILLVADAKSLADRREIQARGKENQLDTSPLYTEFIRLNYARASGTLAGAGGSSSGYAGGVNPESGSSAAGDSGASGGGGGGDQGVLGIIKRRLSRRGGIEVDGRTNTLIITDVRENIDSIRQLVTLLDQPEPQVEIEARIVIAQRNFLRDIGVQLNAAVSNPFGRGGVISSSTGRPIDNVPTGTFSLTTNAFGTAQINAQLTLSETKGQTKTIASPRVTALNNKPAQIESGSQIPVTTVQQGSGSRGGDNTTGVVYTTTFINVPLRLSVTPQITDAGTILMHIVAENNTVNPALASGLGGTPGIDSQRVQTDVLVPDGGTTVLGGVLSDIEVDARSKTPGLGNVPLLKYLFKNKTTQRNTSEILFFITPRIYRPDYQGNPTDGQVLTNGNRSTTILQPVPLGNPPTNSGTNPVTNVPGLIPVTTNPVVPNNNQPTEPAPNKP